MNSLALVPSNLNRVNNDITYHTQMNRHRQNPNVPTTLREKLDEYTVVKTQLNDGVIGNTTYCESAIQTLKAIKREGTRGIFISISVDFIKHVSCAINSIADTYNADEQDNFYHDVYLKLLFHLLAVTKTTPPRNWNKKMKMEEVLPIISFVLGTHDKVENYKIPYLMHRQLHDVKRALDAYVIDGRTWGMYFSNNVQADREQYKALKLDFESKIPSPDIFFKIPYALVFPTTFNQETFINMTSNFFPLSNDLIVYINHNYGETFITSYFRMWANKAFYRS